MPIDINKHEVDIGNLKEQNENDLCSIKELYRKLKEIEEKISEIKYIDSNLADKLKKDYEKLKRIILDENIQLQLDNKINEVNSQLDNKINEVNSQLDKIENKAKRYEVSIRNSYPKVLVKNSEYIFPTEFSLRYSDLPKIYKNKEQFITDFDVSDFKNTGGKNIYVSVKNGLSSNDGLTRTTPCQSLEKALVLASDGDTVIIIDEKDTIIPRLGWFDSGYVTKNINVIAENNVIHFQGDIPTWVKVDNYNNIYQVTRSNCARVVDVNDLDNPVDLIKVDSLDVLENSINAYYTDNVNVYINVKNANNKILPLLKGGRSCIENTNNQNLKLYIENITLIGGLKNIYIHGDSNYNQHELYTKNVKCMYSVESDAILTHNSKRSFHQKTTCAYSSKDGFNYSTTIGDSNIVDFIEIDCVAYGNGNNNINSNIANTHNGSTSHAKSHGIRVNGVYYGNYGGNVIDVQEVKSLNLGCITYDSLSTDASFNQGIGTQQGKGTTMWIDGCVSFNNFADIYCPAGDTITVTNSMFDTIYGGGTKNLSNNY